MATRPFVDASRLVRVLSFVGIALIIASFAAIGSLFALFAAGALIGAAGGAVVFALRSRHGLGASETAEREPSSAGTINIARIPVIGIGGLGLVAMAAFVAWFLPRGQELVTWSAAGGVVGAGAYLTWRHFSSGSPFADKPQETLHLR